MIIEILGVYRAKVRAAARKEAIQVLQMNAALFDRLTKKLVLIELQVTDPGKRFEPWAVTQSTAKKPRPNDQVGYLDEPLTPDGKAIGDFDLSSLPTAGTFRWAMFLHEFDKAKPLTYRGDAIATPKIAPMPRRLAALFKYENP
jgi:hypothetical protein